MPGFISNYAGLKDAIADWMARDDIDGKADNFIDLAEARLNRELSSIETESTINGVVDSREISILSLSVDRPIALFMAESGLDEKEMTQKAPGTFPIEGTSGRPRYWSRDQRTSTDVIAFDRPLDSAYPFRFRYETKLALSDAAPTNWLLTNHPDVYLMACLAWSGKFTKDPMVQQWVADWTGTLREVKNHMAQSKRGVLTVDRSLQLIGVERYGYFDEDL